MHRQLAGVAGTVANLGVVATIVWDLNESWKDFASIPANFFLEIDNKFRHSVTLVNQEIRRRRELVGLQDNDSCEIDGSLHS